MKKHTLKLKEKDGAYNKFVINPEDKSYTKENALPFMVEIWDDSEIAFEKYYDIKTDDIQTTKQDVIAKYNLITD